MNGGLDIDESLKENSAAPTEQRESCDTPGNERKTAWKLRAVAIFHPEVTQTEAETSETRVGGN